MAKILKTSIDEELEKGIEIIDPVDAYKWTLICSEHALSLFEMPNIKAINKAVQTINNNLDNVTPDMAKSITSTLLQEAMAIEKVDTALYFMLMSLAHTVATLIDKKNSILGAIYAGCAILEKTRSQEKFKQEKLYQLEKLEKYLLMYDN